MNNFYVYILRRPDKLLEGKPQPFYVGKGKNYRIKAHFCVGDKHINPYKTAIIKKLQEQGLEVIVEKVLENVTEEEAFTEEIRLIALYGRHNNGTGILTNIASGGEGNSGHVHSKETKRKIGDANRGRISLCKGIPRTEETKRKIGEANKGRRLGKCCSEETKERMRKARTGHPGYRLGMKNSEEMNRKISEGNRGKVMSVESRKKLSISLLKRGLVLTDEHKRRLREVNLGKKLSEETRKRIGAGNKGKVVSTESRLKISTANKGRQHSEETKRKISETKKKFYASNSPESIKARQGSSKAQKGKIAHNRGKKMVNGVYIFADKLEK